MTEEGRKEGRERGREGGRSMVCGMLSKDAKAKFSMAFVCLPVPWGEKT